MGNGIGRCRASGLLLVVHDAAVAALLATYNASGAGTASVECLCIGSGAVCLILSSSASADVTGFACACSLRTSAATGSETTTSVSIACCPNCGILPLWKFIMRSSSAFIVSAEGAAAS